VSRIFLSHSSANNPEAVAIGDWLKREGWDDVFLDVDPERGIAAGERWERSLNQAAQRCEAVLFFVSRAWLASDWCLKEFNLAQRLNKRMFGLLVEDIPIVDLPVKLTSVWQLVRLCSGSDHVMLRVTMPISGEEKHVTFSEEGLARLKTGLQRAGLDPRFFPWPPESDPSRPPYRGLLPLEAEDAGIFFGRGAPIVEALDGLRGLRDATPPRLFVILGASGAGKSSFLRAGLLPRLERDDRNFLPLPVLRPGRAALTGETGLVRSLETAFQLRGLVHTRAEIRAAIESGAQALRLPLAKLVDEVRLSTLTDEPEAKPPVLVLPIDQGEELFLAEGIAEADRLLTLLKELLLADAPGLAVLVTMRSDSFEGLQTAKALEGIRQATLSLPPMPRGAYQAVIEGPVERLKDGSRPLKIEPALTQALLADIESGGGRDALPLLAFTLERLYLEYGGRGRLTLADYEALGRIKGSIEAAVERALATADADSRIPRDRAARLLLLRRGLVPWLAGIDAETNQPRRRVARLSEIPAEARPLIDLLKEQRLLATDVAASGEITIEPAHETLLRQWGLLKGWLDEDAGLLGVLEGIKRASRDWAANGRDPAWLTHASGRLREAERLRLRPDLAANLEPTDRNYLVECRRRETATLSQRRRIRTVVGVLCIMAVAWLVFTGWSNQPYVTAYLGALSDLLLPNVLTAESEHLLKPKAVFAECAHCPKMVVVPAGMFIMGAPHGEAPAHDVGRRTAADDPDYTAYADESPQHPVAIAEPFAVSQFKVTFEEWDACALLGGCPQQPRDEGWGRGTRPVINVEWDDAKKYVAWLSRRTGKPYRLLSEAEWEYAARADRDKAYSWGDEIGTGNADCDGCGSPWDNKRTAPVGSFAANAFGLYDMQGNAWEWVEDCYRDSYDGAPADGSAVTTGYCPYHVVRGGSWYNWPINLRSAVRDWHHPDFRDPKKPETPSKTVGLRVARTLQPPDR
jgi:formylglycine-generating enzyme required for sulfatase activity